MYCGWLAGSGVADHAGVRAGSVLWPMLTDRTGRVRFWCCDLCSVNVAAGFVFLGINAGAGPLLQWIDLDVIDLAGWGRPQYL